MPGPAYPITAYAACNGLGATTAEVLAALRRGASGLTPCPLDVPFETVCGVVPGPLPPPPAPYAASDSRILRVALRAYEGIAAATETAVRRHGPNRVAMILGTSTGGIAATETAFEQWRTTGALPVDYDYARQHSFSAFADVLRDLSGIRGPRYVVSTACSSSGKTFASAERLLTADLADAVLVGGADSLCLTTVRGFHSLGVLAPGPCRPFGADRPGMNVGEGAAFLLLERTGDGIARLLGTGESSDAHHMSAPDPEARGALASMTSALSRAGVSAADVDHVNAHGTGTARNDVAEAQAIRRLVGDQVPVASTKGYTGHMLGAGSATEALFAIAAIDQGWIPESLGAHPLDPDIDIDVTRARRDQPVRTVLSNSFAFGGNNVSLLFGAP